MTMISGSPASNGETNTPALDRRQFSRMLGLSTLGLTLSACAAGDEGETSIDSQAMSSTSRPLAPTQNAESQAALTPETALGMLRDGNARFVAGDPAPRDWGAQVSATAAGQFPFAIVLGCVDSRVPIEVVFDQGVGDIFSARVAGNVINGDLLGSMEFACRLAGSKAVVVLGHTDCGAVKGAIGAADLGNLTGLVQKIEPAITQVEGDRDADNPTYVDAVAETNVRNVMEGIRTESTVLAEMEAAGEIALVGAMYDVASGRVRWL